jgi:diacylglycerol kinase (ATP)
VRLAIIINPISGTGGRPEVARARVELATALLSARALDAEVLVTERPGHARTLTAEALARGATVVAAWGGDGTMNEVASTLAFTTASLAMIPSGSGNGLARELGIPLDPRAAFDVALDGQDLVIDAGELDGHLFFNIAGVGLDARVAHRFAADGLVRRGFARYLEIAFSELLTYVPDEHTIVTDGVILHECAMLVAIANGRQYGNGAVIAPHARVNDGLLDVVVVADRRVIETLLEVPRVFTGNVHTVRGVTIRQAERIEITSSKPVIYHVDGEPFVGAATIAARVRPAALRVRTRRSSEAGT